jgi:hypothetical protein
MQIIYLTHRYMTDIAHYDHQPSDIYFIRLAAGVSYAIFVYYSEKDNNFR